MDDVLTFAEEFSSQEPDRGLPWKILIADDEPSVHLVTKLALGDFVFEGRRVDLLSAYGEADTRRLLEEHPDISLILLDVVMDSMDSGFSLVRYIRNTLQNKDVRIIMRTGQSGNAPEDRIIIDYDINDFKDKTELTVAKLRTTMISSLRTYSHLKIIAEEQRKSSANRAYLHTVIDSLSSVLITLDLHLCVLLWNKEAYRWTGIDSDQAVGHDLFEVAPIFAPLKAMFLELIAPSAEGHSRVEHTAVPLWKGGQVFVHIILQRLSGSTGPEILFRLDDRTAAKLRDDQIIRSQKVNAFSALAAGIGRELSAILESAKGESSDLSRNWSTRASGLLTKLARFSPQATDSPQAADWASVIRTAVNKLDPHKGVSVSFQGPQTPAMVAAESPGLEAIVSHLLENALDSLEPLAGVHEPARTRNIILLLERRRLGEIERRNHPDQSDDDYWCLAVEDQGKGMTLETVDQVFDPYFTTKPGLGLGLGLPLVYSLAEGLGGFVDLVSTPGEGTKVWVWLPKGRETTVQNPPKRPGGVILVCDDEPLMRHVAGKILKHLGFDVLEARDGPAAIEQFLSQKDQIQLVILDMVLPGLPGLDVFKKIHGISPRVPILLSSGFGRGKDVEEALTQGVVGFLQKPYRAESLGEAVRLALGIRTLE